jgi:uncharacterized membrane protein YdfJ with MMPL/SSD domain
LCRSAERNQRRNQRRKVVRRGIASYAKKMSLVEGVAMVNSPAGAFAHGTPVGPPAPQMSTPTATSLTIGSHVDPFSDAGDQQLAALKAVHRPGDTMFAGQAAFSADSLQSLQSRLPFALAMIALATYFALFVFTGNAVLPLKALVLNTLSLCATFGAMVWIFQEGHLSNVLGFTATGYLPPPMPILRFCLAFGISMDYEVFILARVREEWLGSGGTSVDDTRAIALGVARTGRVITAAAATHGGGVFRHRVVEGVLHADVRTRLDADGARRHGVRPLDSGSRVHAVDGPDELVGAETSWLFNLGDGLDRLSERLGDVGAAVTGDEPVMPVVDRFVTE